MTATGVIYTGGVAVRLSVQPNVENTRTYFLHLPQGIRIQFACPNMVKEPFLLKSHKVVPDILLRCTGKHPSDRVNVYPLVPQIALSSF
jgi:hypothetical protein